MPSSDETSGRETEFFELIEQAIDAFIADRTPILSPLGPDVLDFADSTAAFVRGGKRLRASFVRAGWLAAGGADLDPIMIDAATAIELLQGSALVHDDLMDDSDTRRGRPSVHREFEAKHRQSSGSGDAESFGRSAAVLMGDLLLSWSNELLVSTAWQVPAPGGQRAVRLYDLCKAEVTAGQFLDVAAQTRAEVSVADAMLVAQYKSAKYTVERPLQIGAALAGASDDLIDRLSAVALPLGVAFQLRDDMLGVFGDPTVTGKPAGDDLREGKRTVLIARALERSDAEQRDRLLNALGTDHGIEAARQCIQVTGAREALERDIAALEDQADSAVDALEGQAASALRPLVLKATRRAH